MAELIGGIGAAIGSIFGVRANVRVDAGLPELGKGLADAVRGLGEAAKVIADASERNTGTITSKITDAGQHILSAANCTATVLRGDKMQVRQCKR